MNLRVQKFQKRSLQSMLVVSLVCLIWGMLRIVVDGVSHEEAVAAFAAITGPASLALGTLRAEPIPLLATGIAVLVLTPFIRLLILTVDFAVQRDWLYVAMSAVVGAIVLLSFLLRLH